MLQSTAHSSILNMLLRALLLYLRISHVVSSWDVDSYSLPSERHLLARQAGALVQPSFVDFADRSLGIAFRDSILTAVSADTSRNTVLRTTEVLVRSVQSAEATQDSTESATILCHLAYSRTVHGLVVVRLRDTQCTIELWGIMSSSFRILLPLRSR